MGEQSAVPSAVDGLLAEQCTILAHFTSWPCSLYDPRGRLLRPGQISRQPSRHPPARHACGGLIASKTSAGAMRRRKNSAPHPSRPHLPCRRTARIMQLAIRPAAAQIGRSATRHRAAAAAGRSTRSAGRSTGVVCAGRHGGVVDGAGLVFVEGDLGARASRRARRCRARWPAGRESAGRKDRSRRFRMRSARCPDSRPMRPRKPPWPRPLHRYAHRPSNSVSLALAPSDHT